MIKINKSLEKRCFLEVYIKLIKGLKMSFFCFLSIFDEKFDFLSLFKKGQKRGVFGQKRVIFDPFLNA